MTVWCGSARALAVSQLEQLEAARACARESQRLERLACFDRLFATPVVVSAPSAAPVRRSARWLQAYAQEQQRTAGDGALYRHSGSQAGHLITLPALGSAVPRPLLTIQCHHNITELSLMLPQPLPEERVTLAWGDYQQVWRTREHGLVLSGGRGLPAIATIKAMVPLSHLQLSSTNPAVNGLVFDLAGLTTQLRPVRVACSW
ncbi:type VI secretion system-associated protein [Marinobacter sp. X15-166B]|nr:type VI secretion system-associated protein [Marinobacter sp. X15-166B]